MCATMPAGCTRWICIYAHRAQGACGVERISLAVSRDGRYVAAGSYVPHTMVIMDASTLEPLHMIELAGVDPDGKHVPADAGIITATPYANWFVVALEQAGQVWIVDLDQRGMPINAVTNVGRHLHDGFLPRWPAFRGLLVRRQRQHRDRPGPGAHRAQDPESAASRTWALEPWCARAGACWA